MKLNYPKEWFERSAQLEGDSEVGAGTVPTRSFQPAAIGNLALSNVRFTFGQFVELWRRNMGWDSEKLAEQSGIELEEVRRIEKDPTWMPDVDDLGKLAEVFRVSSSGLLLAAGWTDGRSSRLGEAPSPFGKHVESVAPLSALEAVVLEAMLESFD